MSSDIIEAKETVTIGDTLYSVDDVTPTQYFDYVKNMKVNIEDENLQNVAENCLSLLKKTKLTGQTEMARKIFEQYSVIMKELNAAKYGFNIIVYRTNIEKFIKDISAHPVKIIELENYKREIPDDICERLLIAKENDLFDEYYVLFTDYTSEETKKVAKHRREKDPILFGAFKSEDNKNVPLERFFFIGDWVDEYCELTLEEMTIQYQKSENEGMKYKVEVPKDIDELKEYLGMIEEVKPDKSILTKIKTAAKKRTTTRKRKTVKKDD